MSKATDPLRGALVEHAGTAKLSDEAHRTLAGYGDVEVRRAWSQRRQLPAAVIAARLVAETDGQVLTTLLDHVVDLDEAALSALSRHDNMTVAVRVALQSACPDEDAAATFQRAHRLAKGATEATLLHGHVLWLNGILGKERTVRLLCERFDVRIAAKLAPSISDEETQRVLLRRLASLSPHCAGTDRVLRSFAQVLWVRALRPAVAVLAQRHAHGPGAVELRRNIIDLDGGRSDTLLGDLDHIRESIAQPDLADEAIRALRRKVPQRPAVVRRVAHDAMSIVTLTCPQRLELARLAGGDTLRQAVVATLEGDCDDATIRALLEVVRQSPAEQQLFALIATGRIEQTTRILGTDYPPLRLHAKALVAACTTADELRHLHDLGVSATSLLANDACDDQLLVDFPAQAVNASVTGRNRICALALNGSSDGTIDALSADQLMVLSTLIGDGADAPVGELLDVARTLSS